MQADTDTITAVSRTDIWAIRMQHMGYCYPKVLIAQPTTRCRVALENVYRRLI